MLLIVKKKYFLSEISFVAMRFLAKILAFSACCSKIFWGAIVKNVSLTNVTISRIKLNVKEQFFGFEYLFIPLNS